MKKIIKACIIFCCISFAFGCSDDESLPAVPEEPRIALLIPGADEVRVYSTATADENRIEDCFVVVFRDGSYYNMEEIEIDKITANGKASALLPQLQNFEIESGDRIYVICNTGLSAPPTGITESNINDKFPPAKAYYFSGEALPMSGSAVWSSSSSTTVTLTRAVAKVQIKLGENFSMGNLETFFYPMDESLYWDADFFKENINLCGFVVGNYAGKSDILQPSPPGLSQTPSSAPGNYDFLWTDDNYIRLMQYATADNMAVYVSEYPNSTMDFEGSTIPDDAFNSKRQYLLMVDWIENNRPGNANGLAGIWRLDFYDAANKKFLDIKRNHTYTFTINRIRSNPYPLPFGGSYSVYPLSKVFINAGYEMLPASNIEYTVAVEDNWANRIYSNGQYALLLSRDTINDGNINLPLYLKVCVPAGVDISSMTSGMASGNMMAVYDSEYSPAGGTSSAFTVYLNGNPLMGNSNITIAIPTIGEPTNIYTFTFNPSHPRAQYFDDASLHIWIGNIYKRIPIKLTVP
ncbi:MAG: hypothetical protein LBL33_03495 [Tannerella sp.]|jgi:hypothetical protein|nr:hypothetical protein [Tannerella sp.]